MLNIIGLFNETQQLGKHWVKDFKLSFHHQNCDGRGLGPELYTQQLAFWERMYFLPPVSGACSMADPGGLQYEGVLNTPQEEGDPGVLPRKNLKIYV